MGLCRGSTPATCQRRVRHQAHWCRGLARLPTTPHCQTAGNVVDIADNAFRDCKLLNIVLAPGCRDFGYKAFAECCSLQWVYALDGAANVFNGEANFGQYLFQGCINLAEVTLSVRFHPPRVNTASQDYGARTGLPQLHGNLRTCPPKALCGYSGAHV